MLSFAALGAAALAFAWAGDKHVVASFTNAMDDRLVDFFGGVLRLGFFHVHLLPMSSRLIFSSFRR